MTEYKSCRCSSPLKSSRETHSEATESFDDYSSEYDEEYSYSEVPQITINFGKIRIGDHSIEKLRVNCKIGDRIALTRDPNANSIYESFNYCERDRRPDHIEWSLKFTPKFAFQTYVDRVCVLKNGLHNLGVTLRGESVGPRLQFSTTSLKFVCDTKQTKLSKPMEIKNVSEVEATYQFDCSSDGIFTVDKSCGTIPAKCHVFLTVTFRPPSKGVFNIYLTCLLLHQEPITVHLIGYRGPDKEIETKYELLPRSQYELFGYMGYMKDCLQMLPFTPQCSLSEQFLDFGMVAVPDCEGVSTEQKSLCTSLTNHLKSAITVKWCKHKIFNISPQSVTIPSTESIMYEVLFTPDVKEHLFFAKMTAQVYWTRGSDDETVTVPFTVSLRLLGHSFAINTSWIPQLKMIPETIILPCATPNFPTYTSFLLQTTGYLPVAYKLVPPDNSNFICKPMVGLVKSRKIVTVQLNVKSVNRKPYVECWHMELNGRKGRGVPFYMKGFCELPALKVGRANAVRFSTMIPEAIEHEAVRIKNTTAQFIHYELLLNEGKHKHLCIKSPKGYIAANETIISDWYCTGLEDMPLKVEVPVRMHILQQGDLITGNEVTSQVSVYAETIYGELCANPKSYDFREVHSGTTSTAEFKLYNFGKSTIHYSLRSNDEHNALFISPSRGTLRMNSIARIKLSLTPSRCGRYRVGIEYQVRKCADSSEILSHNPVNLFNLAYDCEITSFSFVSIPYHNYTGLFSRAVLWDVLRLDDFNTAASRLTAEHDQCRVDMFVPDFVVSDTEFKIILLLRNNSAFRSCIDVARKKTCSCALADQGKEISLRKLEYNCVHREISDLVLFDNMLHPKCKYEVKLKIRYCTPEDTPCLYTINLSNNRHIDLYVHVRGIDAQKTILSTLRSNLEFRLRDVFIGELNPAVQIYWLYNNSYRIAQYFVDTSEMNQLNVANKFKVCQCLNPFGYIPSFAAQPLLFKFVPIEAKLYKIFLPISCDNREILLKMVGVGLPRYVPLQRELKDHLEMSFGYNKVYLSAQYIVLEPMLQWSTQRKLIFMKNQANEDSFYFSWQFVSYGGLIQVEFEPCKGLLKPRERRAITITTYSMQTACAAEFVLSCKLVSQSVYLQHKRSEAEYRERDLELTGQFIITEKGTTYPQNDVVITPFPYPVWLTLAIDVVIVSFEDRDIHLKPAQQMTNSPQPTVALSAFRATHAVMHKGPNRTPSRLSNRTLRVRKLLQQMENVDDFVLLIGQMLQRIVADAVDCYLFRHMMELQQSLVPPYYIQMTSAKNRVPSKRSWSRSVVNYMRTPRLDVINEVEVAVVANSLCEIFRIATTSVTDQTTHDSYNLVVTTTDLIKSAIVEPKILGQTLSSSSLRNGNNYTVRRSISKRFLKF